MEQLKIKNETDTAAVELPLVRAASNTVERASQLVRTLRFMPPPTEVDVQIRLNQTKQQVTCNR